MCFTKCLVTTHPIFSQDNLPAFTRLPFSKSIPYLFWNSILICDLCADTACKGLSPLVGISMNMPFSKRTPLTTPVVFTEIFQSAIIFTIKIKNYCKNKMP